VNATDDVAVAAVNFLVNGQVVFTATSAPYQFNFSVPIGISSLTIGATAVDFGNNIGTAQNVVINVIPDPGTTVTGRVLDKTQTPVAGATVTTVGGKSSTTAADGTFSISGVPTVRGNISVRAVGTVNGVSRSGSSASVPPVAKGTTNVGDIILGGGFIVVANSNDDTATVIDPSTSPPNVVATLPTGASFPIGASVTPDGSTALVSNFNPGFLTFIDLTTTPPSVKGTPLSMGTPTESTAITSDSRFAVTADGCCGPVNVSAIAIGSESFVTTLSLPATAVAITPDNGTVILGDDSSNQFSVLSLSAQGVLSDTGVRVQNTGGFGQRTIAIAPDGHFALATNLSGSMTILKIDPVAGITVAGSIPLCCSPSGITIAPNGTKAYVAMTDSTVAILSIDSADNVTDTGIRISIPGGTPATFYGTPGIAFSSDGTRAYVSNYGSNTITILDATADSIVGTVPVGSGPAGIGVPR
jgi:YVTN family beta-propeller protein